MTNAHGLQTALIHAGEKAHRYAGAVSIPIFQSSTFEYNGSADEELKYIRYSNTPNHKVLEEKLAFAEGAESALITSTGMSAIASTLLSVLKQGDHFLVQNTIYGGTHSLIANDLAALGIGFDFIDGTSPEHWQNKIKPNTKAIYVEAIANPLLKITNLPAVIEFARNNSIISIIDNTFTTPVNYQAARAGFDIVVHSATKYLNGHSDICAGVVVANKEKIEKVYKKVKSFGGSLDPHAVYLFTRGLKTLVIRMNYINESTLKIASFLEGHPEIETIYYPGLKSNHQYELANKLFNGLSGMISFKIKGDLNRINKFMNKLTLPVVAPSLGGVETLITRPAITSHAAMSQEQREALDITDNLIRLSVGLESTQDLIKDLEQALKV